MNKPELVQRFTDNGEHSHWELVDDNGIVIWSENTRIFIIVDSLARQNFIYRNMFEKLELLTKQLPNYFNFISKVYSPAAAFYIKSGGTFDEKEMEEMTKQAENINQLLEQIKL